MENAKLVFSVQDHDAQPDPIYVRNTASWCYDLRQAMTCISPWNFNTAPNVEPGGPKGAGTAITAQHIITSEHYELQRGALIRFITADNQVIVKTIRGRATHPDFYRTTPHGPSDITIYTLDSLLPASITPCKLLPANYTNRLSHLRSGRPPVMILDQEEKALVTELGELDYYTGFPSTSAEYLRPALHRQRLAFFEPLIDGDSSNPAFLLINNTLALLSVARGSDFSSFSDGVFVTPQIDTLNAMIVAADADCINQPPFTPISTGFTVQTVDLSGFNSYTPPNPP